MKVIITGASGVLGSAIHHAFTNNTNQIHTVLALSHTRTTTGLLQLDLTHKDQVEKVFAEFKPDWVIHCAAERRPDVAEKDPEGTQKLNVNVPAHLAALAKSFKYTLVYISTEYVFDGTSPPYTPSAKTNPLQLYGRTKRDGEEAVLAVDGAKVVVLRVPVLYGPAPKNSDSAVNILLDIVQDQSGKQYKMDHYATKYPTNVVDIAGFLARLAESKPPIPIPPILHYSAAEPFTKYEMCLVFAKILGLPHTHIVPQSEPESDAGATTRPRDCQLYTKETEDLGVEGGLGLSLFEEWWIEYLGVT
ncbi:NAD(P)-binding protein [Gymnopus androsaceus JB14]|uniref:NAD(P)-binding protein n=1 Tax=Gymnopus androsaceus JB14 TaxID=1447944 RepID=A0A6A4HPX2_9AGAR|nr:NAD(P)-binding protein [Gymnopus androsaceus JB14]